jgi:hypothetical protein
MQTYDEYSDERIPLGYLITFRSYGTWLHGKRGSVDRFHNVYGTPRLPGNEKRKQYNRSLLKQPPVKLTASKRAAVLSAIKETCDIANGNCGLPISAPTTFMPWCRLCASPSQS